MAAIPRTDLILWASDPGDAEIAILRQLAEWAIRYPDVKTIRARFSSDVRLPHETFPVLSPLRLAEPRPLASDLLLRTGPQLWHDTGWTVLEE
ncbi:hypothetical protein [Pseudogemmobacter bohemicus]|uniref:hypothetical protein n=1 Tax=Pseudogemmobacter bohemicus TaxID=2250708 RepID=UPI000DD2E9C3|nr:hypothetical protein [Pseudogemmobacter bohemicus]